ncbi:MAG: hypothetical protein IJK70_02250 [Bacteroidales bacterium]|nr:hypothetical protein [Bacteroidales bacterium]
MKKTLFIVFLVTTLFCWEANAQLNITAAVEKKPERLLVGQVSYSYLYKTSEGFYEYWANTDNQFDEHTCHLFLGNSPETAIQTLKDLRSLMEKEVPGVTVQQKDGNIVLVFKKQLGVRMLWIKQDGLAGKSWISLPMVDKFIKYFDNLSAKENDGEDNKEEDIFIDNQGE